MCSRARIPSASQWGLEGCEAVSPTRCKFLRALSPPAGVLERQLRLSAAISDSLWLKSNAETDGWPRLNTPPFILIEKDWRQSPTLERLETQTPVSPESWDAVLHDLA